jgi:hypothetical protein
MVAKALDFAKQKGIENVFNVFLDSRLRGNDGDDMKTCRT